jgi:hypothetical protein
MIAVGMHLVSEDVLEKKFVCDLNACKGACCVAGDSGAPLSDEEAGIIEDDWESIKPFIPKEGVEVIEKEGNFMIDSDGDVVTPLVNGAHCAYTVFTPDGTTTCGIELAWKAGETKFRKPISCHLYPIRVTKLKDCDALNYNQWDVCKPACACGEKLQVPVYKFLKDALIRKYGEAWYAELEELAEVYLKERV